MRDEALDRKEIQNNILNKHTKKKIYIYKIMQKF